MVALDPAEIRVLASWVAGEEEDEGGFGLE
jgi:hypothetical protein